MGPIGCPETSAIKWQSALCVGPRRATEVYNHANVILLAQLRLAQTATTRHN
jgi:hypothetical protein